MKEEFFIDANRVKETRLIHTVTEATNLHSEIT